MIRLKQRHAGRRPLSIRTPRRRPSARGAAKPFGRRQTAHGLLLFCLRSLTPKAGIAVVAAPLALVSHNSLADEGGSSFWNPGSFASLAATPLQPGLSLTSIYYHPSVSSGKDVARCKRRSKNPSMKQPSWSVAPE